MSRLKSSKWEYQGFMENQLKKTACLLWALFAVLYVFRGSGAIAGAWEHRAKKDNVLRYALHASRMGCLDPDYQKGSQDRVYADMVFNSLWRYLPGDAGHMAPDLALDMPEFRMENGRQIWTVQLRPKVYFHESPYSCAHELTARDVVYSLEKASDPERSSSAGYFTPMAFKILDSHTLEISLDKSISPLFFLARLSNWHGGYILSRQAIEKGGYDNFCRYPVGTGPFKFKSYKDGEKLVLTANPDYFRGRPKLDGVEIYFMPDTEKREQAFLSGEMDIIYGTGEPGWIEKMEKEPGVLVDILGPGSTGLFHFNTAMPPLNDIRVRRALAAGLDRKAFMEATSPKLVTECQSPMSPAFLPGGLSNEQIGQLAIGSEYNPHAAVERLKQAGYPQGFDLDVVVSEKRVYKENYLVLKYLLEQINVRLNLKIVSHARYHQLVRKDVNPIVLYFSFRPNADIYLRGFFHSDSIVVTGKTPQTNFSHYSGIDKILDDALGTIEPLRQISMWQQSQIKLLNDVVVFPLFDINQLYVRRDYVDYHHPLRSSLCDYPQFTEETRLQKIRPISIR